MCGKWMGERNTCCLKSPFIFLYLMSRLIIGEVEWFKTELTISEQKNCDVHNFFMKNNFWITSTVTILVQVAHNVFEAGLKHFMHEPVYILEYVSCSVFYIRTLCLDDFVGICSSLMLFWKCPLLLSHKHYMLGFRLWNKSLRFHGYTFLSINSFLFIIFTSLLQWLTKQEFYLQSNHFKFMFV